MGIGGGALNFSADPPPPLAEGDPPPLKFEENGEKNDAKLPIFLRF